MGATLLLRSRGNLGGFPLKGFFLLLFLNPVVLRQHNTCSARMDRSNRRQMLPELGSSGQLGASVGSLDDPPISSLGTHTPLLDLSPSPASGMGIPILHLGTWGWTQTEHAVTGAGGYSQ